MYTDAEHCDTHSNEGSVTLPQPPKCRRPGELYKVVLVTERLIITEADKGQSQNIYEIRKNVFKIRKKYFKS